MLTPDELLERCNQFREAGGAPRITKLRPGRARSNNACLIARNLNFDCQIGYYGESGWITSLDPRMQVVAEALGLERRHWSEQSFRLPDELTMAAVAFDRHDYPADLYET